MTPEQAKWLQANKPYRAMSRTPGGFRYIKVGMLHADGSFDLTGRGARPVVRPGSFEVGILEQTPPPSMVR